MYSINYSVISFCYGNVSGSCGNYDKVEDAIAHELLLREHREKGETFAIQVNWEKVDV